MFHLTPLIQDMLTIMLILFGVVFMFQFIVGVNSEGKTIDASIPTATEEVLEFEMKISASLPNDYRNFLKNNQWGSVLIQMNIMESMRASK
jgi:hypothetical protein